MSRIAVDFFYFCLHWIKKNFFARLQCKASFEKLATYSCSPKLCFLYPELARTGNLSLKSKVKHQCKVQMWNFLSVRFFVKVTIYLHSFSLWTSLLWQELMVDAIMPVYPLITQPTGSQEAEARDTLTHIMQASIIVRSNWMKRIINENLQDHFF